MGLLDYLNDDNIDWNRDESYIGRLITLFATMPAVAKAYFGLLYHEEQEADLFLGVELMEEDAAIQPMVDKLRDTYLPYREIIFISSQAEPELMQYIAESNFPFYVKNRHHPLHLAIMKQWFNPAKYKSDLIRQLKTGTVISLFKDFNPFGSDVTFQTYIRDGKEFIPLFSEEDMVSKSGMMQVPEDLTVMSFDWAKINSVVSGNLKAHFYILNPGTSFEVELII
jgi:hypothetical protein